MIQVKRGLESGIPTLGVGEPAFSTDNHSLFIGSASGNIKMSRDYMGSINVKYGNDLNNALAQGKYSCESNNTNNPLGDYGALDVINETMSGSVWIWHIYYSCNGHILRRYKINSNDWSSWEYVLYKQQQNLTLINGWKKDWGNFFIKQDERVISIFIDSIYGTANQNIATIPQSFNPNNMSIDFKNGLKLSGTTLSSTTTNLSGIIAIYTI